MLLENTVFNIEKLDGTNFPFWKEKIYNVLVQKKLNKPIKLKGVKPKDMDQDAWSKIDKLAKSTIYVIHAKGSLLQCEQDCDKLQLTE